jgi:methionyl-tRNA formyltransferase
VIKVWKATVVQGDANGAPPGSVLAISAAGVDVACGEGVLRVQQMQRPGGRRVPAIAAAQSLTVVPGDRLAS